MQATEFFPCMPRDIAEPMTVLFRVFSNLHADFYFGSTSTHRPPPTVNPGPPSLHSKYQYSFFVCLFVEGVFSFYFGFGFPFILFHFILFQFVLFWRQASLCRPEWPLHSVCYWFDLVLVFSTTCFSLGILRNRVHVLRLLTKDWGHTGERRKLRHTYEEGTSVFCFIHCSK